MSLSLSLSLSLSPRHSVIVGEPEIVKLLK